MGASGLFNQYYPDATKWLTSRFFFTRISSAAFQLQQWTGLLQGLLDVRQVVLHLLVNQKSKHVLKREQLLLCLPGGRACGNHRRCRSQSRYYPRSSDPRNPPEIITRPHTAHAHFNIYIMVCKIAEECTFRVRMAVCTASSSSKSSEYLGNHFQGCHNLP